jgi:uncharacterized protein YdbL (DUF1318 family)
MNLIRKLATLAAAMVAAASLSVAHAQAGDPVIMQAKAQAVVGEMYTGYLGIADEGKATPDIKRHVDEVNAKRLQLFTQSAQANSQTVAVIAGLSAEKQIARAGSGEVVKPGASAAWTKKP